MSIIAVICEVVLALACAIAIGLCSRTRLPSGLFWAIGFALIGITAGLGALRLAGFEGVRPAHLFFNGLSASVGGAALLLGALFGVVLRLGPGLAAGAAAAGGAALLAVGLGLVPDFGQPLAVLALIGMIVVALIGLKTSRTAAFWLVAGIVLAAAAEFARQGRLGPLPIGPYDLYHLLLAGMALSFGMGAKSHG